MPILQINSILYDVQPKDSQNATIMWLELNRRIVIINILFKFLDIIIFIIFTTY